MFPCCCGRFVLPNFFVAMRGFVSPNFVAAAAPILLECLVAHGASVMVLHCCRSSPCRLAVSSVRPRSFSSFFIVLYRVTLGLTLLHFPWGVHLSATLCIQSASIRRTCPSHLQLLSCTTIKSDSRLHNVNRSLLLILFNQKMRLMRRRHCSKFVFPNFLCCDGWVHLAEFCCCTKFVLLNLFVGTTLAYPLSPPKKTNPGAQKLPRRLVAPREFLSLNFAVVASLSS